MKLLLLVIIIIFLYFRLASCLDWEQGNMPKSWMRTAISNLKQAFSIASNLPKQGVSLLCCGLTITVQKAPFTRRSRFVIIAGNIYFWSHFAVVFFNLVDFVKDVTFATAVQHFDTNIIQYYSETRYKQYYNFNVHYVFLISIGLMIVTQVITYTYWSMITRKPKFLLACEHQSLVSRMMQVLVQIA